MPELIWDAKYQDGRKAGPVRIALRFQTIETVNESARDRQRSLEFFSAGREGEWRNRLIWGDKKYVLPSLLAEFAGQVNLIYIDPPFDTGADFSFIGHHTGLPGRRGGQLDLHQRAFHIGAEGISRHLGCNTGRSRAGCHTLGPLREMVL